MAVLLHQKHRLFEKGVKMFDIQFTKNDENPRTCTEVYVKINTGLSIERSIIPFNFDCCSQYSAELLLRHLRFELDKSLEKIRENAYNRGWKDAKSKQKKLTTFFNGFDSTDVGF